MHKGKLLFLSLLASMAWNCEQATPTDGGSRNENLVAPTINAVTKLAARQAGYQMSREVMPQADYDPFGQEALEGLRNAGLCENFVSLVAELGQSLETAGTEQPFYTPRLRKVVSCLTEKAGTFTSQPSEGAIMDVVENCFCDGSGTLFRGLRNWTLNAYSAPSTPGGGSYSAPNTTSSPYSDPAAAQGYSAPRTQGYSSPSL